jgi:hypothetical protein
MWENELIYGQIYFLPWFDYMGLIGDCQGGYEIYLDGDLVGLKGYLKRFYWGVYMEG